MKSTPHGSIPNLRGRKSYTFSCMCCGAYNLLGRERDRIAKKEILAAMRDNPIKQDRADDSAGGS